LDGLDCQSDSEYRKRFDFGYTIGEIIYMSHPYKLKFDIMKYDYI